MALTPNTTLSVLPAIKGNPRMKRLLTTFKHVGTRLLYLFYLVGLQESAGLFEVGFERFRLQLGFDRRAMLGVHLFLGGNLQAQTTVRHQAGLKLPEGIDTDWVQH